MEELSNFIRCLACGRKIEFERPLFCPYCGAKLEPIDGLLDGTESDVYPASDIAPLLMRVFLIWTAAVVPLTLVLGRRAFLGSFVLLVVVLVTLACLFALGGGAHRKKD